MTKWSARLGSSFIPKTLRGGGFRRIESARLLKNSKDFGQFTTHRCISAHKRSLGGSIYVLKQWRDFISFYIGTCRNGGGKTIMIFINHHIICFDFDWKQNFQKLKQKWDKFTYIVKKDISPWREIHVALKHQYCQTLFPFSHSTFLLRDAFAAFSIETVITVKVWLTAVSDSTKSPA